MRMEHANMRMDGENPESTQRNRNFGGEGLKSTHSKQNPLKTKKRGITPLPLENVCGECLFVIAARTDGGSIVLMEIVMRRTNWIGQEFLSGK